MISVDALASDMVTKPIEALIADVSLVSATELPRIVKILGNNRPLILVGAPGSQIEDVPRDATWMQRPVTKETLLLWSHSGFTKGGRQDAHRGSWYRGYSRQLTVWHRKSST